ncbi:hypothetical protein BKA93DRAFT_828887 [Sparassis latifolia]|uniref:Uncharacterized protein n=1 Tax=Sparassis crispa TaxID=139825 RepID=A0A401GUL6_9APHY|nr:predicted protein [Sparassis crispa]GBE85424.1 predicted protein [Sparassis crispa]
MSKTSVPLKDLVVGDIIYANIIIDKADMADPNSKSGTAKNIKAGKPVRRLCVVLVAGSSSVVVTYLATFNQSKTLPASFTDKSYWYPVSPATKEGTLDPLPSLNGTAQWVSLRKKQTVTEDPVEKVTEKFSAASVKLILAAMKA